MRPAPTLNLCRAIPFLALVAAGAGAPPTAALGEGLPGPVPAAVVRVVDGDTLRVRARIWIGQEVETLVRIRDIDAPEMRARCPAERGQAEAARHYLAAMLQDDEVHLHDIRHGRYAGRVIARITGRNGADLGAALIAAGLARRYDGGARQSWCP